MRFAARYGLKYPTLASWMAWRRRERMEVEREGQPKPEDTAGTRNLSDSPVRWLEAVADDAAARSALARGVILHLRGGVRMEVAHADQAVLILAFSITGIPLAGGGHGTNCCGKKWTCRCGAASEPKASP